MSWGIGLEGRLRRRCFEGVGDRLSTYQSPLQLTGSVAANGAISRGRAPCLLSGRSRASTKLRGL
jgi:hypothetical protein